MRFRLHLGLAALLAMAACGDDDDGTDDAATIDLDGGGDATTARDTGGGRDTSTPPRDTSVDTAPPMTSLCDPFMGGDCEDGEKCSVVIESDSAGDVSAVFFGCVPTGRNKGIGAPCSFQTVDPMMGGADADADDCMEGLFCSSANQRPGAAAVCETMCDGENTDCGENGYCSGANDDPFFGLCSTASNCDPVFQTGCGAGEACFTLGATNGDVVADCFTWEPADGEDGLAGSSCMFLNNCAPGYSCRPISMTEAECLQFCDATPVTIGAPPDAGMDAAVDAGDTDAGDTDAGIDAGDTDAGEPDSGAMDAGTPDTGPMLTGECPMDLECIALEPGEGGMVRPMTTPGVCADPSTMMM